MSKHRKPSTARRIARRLARLLPATIAAGAVLASAGTAGAATRGQHTVRNDVKLCAAFHRWTDAGGQGDAIVWARYLPGTARWLYADGEALAWAIHTDAPDTVKRVAFDDLWADCSIAAR